MAYLLFCIHSGACADVQKEKATDSSHCSTRKCERSAQFPYRFEKEFSLHFVKFGDRTCLKGEKQPFLPLLHNYLKKKKKSFCGIMEEIVGLKTKTSYLLSRKLSINNKNKFSANIS